MSVQQKSFGNELQSKGRSAGLANRFCAALSLLISIIMLPGVCSADLVLGSGTEATWLYNPTNGNLKFRIENGEEYNGLILRTTLPHIDSTASDFSTRFLLSSHPGITGPFAGVAEDELAFFLFVGSSAPCPDCLTGTTDFGNIITPSLTTTDIIDNWTTVSSVRPSGGKDSSVDLTAFGVVAVPEPSPFLLGCLVSVGCGLAVFVRRRMKK